MRESGARTSPAGTDGGAVRECKHDDYGSQAEEAFLEGSAAPARIPAGSGVRGGCRLAGWCGRPDHRGLCGKRAHRRGEKLTAENVNRVKVRLGDVEGHYVTAEAGLPEGMVAVQRIGPDQLVPRDSLGKPDALDRKPVAITIDEALPEQVAAGSRVDAWVALPDARNGFSEPKLLLPGAEIAEVTPGSTALGSSRSTVVMVLVTDEQMPRLLGAQANKAKISVVWNPGGGTS